MEEEEQGRTEQATPHKRAEARKRGQVAKSLDFNTMVIMAGFSAVLTGGAAFGMTQLAGLVPHLARRGRWSGRTECALRSAAWNSHTVC